MRNLYYAVVVPHFAYYCIHAGTVAITIATITLRGTIAAALWVIGFTYCCSDIVVNFWLFENFETNFSCILKEIIKLNI